MAGKRGPTRLGFALLLLFHLNHGRFPRGRGELPDEVVAYVAVQVKVPSSEIAFYDETGKNRGRLRGQCLVIGGVGGIGGTSAGSRR